MIDASLMTSGLVVGIIFGFILQRGRFCMNSAFRDVILMKDYTLLKAVVVAIVIQMIGFHLIATLGWIPGLNPKPLYTGANIFGGFIFGIGMVLAAGCASGTTYRVGEGMVGSFVALIGLMIGGLVTSGGALAWLNSDLKSGTFEVITNETLGVGTGPYIREGNMSLTLANVLGLNPWILVATITIIVLAILIWKREGNGKGTLWNWWFTGIAVGIVGIIAFLAFQKYGLGISGGWFGFLKALIAGDPEMLNWFTFLVIGVVLGSATAAIMASEFKLRAPDAKRLLQQFIGGLIMGIGAVIGTACNIGHILSGIPQLSLGSILGGIFIVLGCWTTAYIMFMRG